MSNPVPEFIDLSQSFKDFFLPCPEWPIGENFQQCASKCCKLLGRKQKSPESKT